MFVKAICVLAVTTAVSSYHALSSQHIDRHDGHPQEVTIHDKHGYHHVDYYAYPKYKFEYKVDDDHTGDHKQQQEHRDGHDTESKYSWHVKHIVHKKHHDEKKEHKKEIKEHSEVKQYHEEHKHDDEQSKQHHEEHKHQQENSEHSVLIDYYAHPKYVFGYKVNDPHTGDNKEQHEDRDGHDTKSDYSLHLKHVVPEKHDHH